MAAVGFISDANGTKSTQQYHHPGKVTLNVFFACLVASSGGLLFGYDIGISGGVTSMDSFLKKFFPSVYRKAKTAAAAEASQYCKFDSQLLTAFTSSLYLAALVASFFASAVTRRHGRRNSMLLGGAVFLVGAVLNGAAENVAMLIIGRILLGVGVGFTTQSIPMYLSEMAPASLRGMLNIIFQLMITIGILAASIVNYLAPKIAGSWAWRISLGGAAVPALIITGGAVLLPDTPNSLIDRGRPEQARAVLENIRGTADVEEEYKGLVAASEEARTVEHPWRSIVRRPYRPHFVMSLAIPSFTQLTGINVIMFYAPVLFKTIGFGSDAALYSAVITGGVNVVATFVSIATVDRVGRRFLFLQGGAQMLICQIVVAILIGKKFGINGVADLSKGYANTVVAFICMYVAGFAWSWGPMGCLVPSEIYPLEIRSAGLSMNVSVSMLFTFAIAQAFLAMLCRLKYFLFFLFAIFVFAMTLFIFFFMPETKNVPIEEMGSVWKRHWFWSRYTTKNGVSEGRELVAGRRELTA